MTPHAAPAGPIVEPVALTGAELAIARSVLFASLFDYPLTLAQVRQTLIESTQGPTEILRTYEQSARLRQIVRYDGGLFTPADRPELPVERRRREARSRAFLRRHRWLLTVIGAWPTIRMVALSGSVAHLNLEEGGDLDLFIVTRGRRVWCTTVAVILLAKLLRRRQTLCANFVLADTRLCLGPGDLFAASQIIHLKPLVGVDVYDEFVDANPFVRRFYPNFHRSAARQLPMRITSWPESVRRGLGRLCAAPGAVAEVVCRWAYRRYLLRHTGTWRSPEQVSLDDDCLKLHTRSHRGTILERFDDRVRRAVSPDGRAALRPADPPAPDAPRR